MIELASPTWQVYATVLADATEIEAFKQRLIQWLARFEQFSYLDAHGHNEDVYHAYELLVGVGCLDWVQAQAGEGAFELLDQFRQQYPEEYLFGYLGYDLKNEVEALTSRHADPLNFPDLLFFVPEHRIALQARVLSIASATRRPVDIFREIQARPLKVSSPSCSIELQARISREEYLATVQKIRQEIAQGNLYEMNFCQEFYQEAAELDPFGVFQRLRTKMNAPFTSFFRWQEHFALCASPERFLAKRGEKLISQPIKGTIRRGKTPEEDAALRQELYLSPKNRSENVMIVDLTRNDLARSCRPGTVQVEELFGIYGFATVHQMISTVSGQLRPNVSLLTAIRNAFPMGSMTGAPKVRSMQLIECLESSRRGLYSGTIGYFSPHGDFDFNVVIRSLLYNQASGYLSLSVGGAIVYDSDPEEEYEECLLKAERLREVLRSNA
jgi:para-aminobenzoate synthetase component 1